MGGKSSSPAAPDYVGQANATAAGNLAAARSQTQANRINQETPYGSITYSQGDFDQAGYDAAMAKYNASLSAPSAPAAQTLNFGNSKIGNLLGAFGGTTQVQPEAGTQTQLTAPNRQDFMGSPDQWSSKITLDPAQQALLDQQNKTSLGLSALQDQATQRVSDAYATPFDMSGLQEMTTDNSGLVNGYNNYVSGLQGGVDKYNNYVSGLQGGVDKYNNYVSGLQGGVDKYNNYVSGLQGGVDDYNSYVKSLQGGVDSNTGMDAWDKATDLIRQRQNPELDRQQAALDAKLANQGLTAGSEGWGIQQQNFGKTRNDADIAAQQAGLSAQQQFYNQALGNANLKQGVAGLMGSGINYGNSQANLMGQGINYGNSQANLMGQGVGYGTNQANLMGQGIGYGTNQANLMGQGVGYGFQNAGLNNTARAQQLTERQALRNMPLQELNAIRSGSTVTNPSFTAPGQQGQTTGADLLGASNAQYSNALNSSNAQNAQAAGTTNSLLGLAGGLGSAYLGTAGGSAALTGLMAMF